MLNIIGLGRLTSEFNGGGVVSADTSTLWASFWTILGGFVAAGLGGAIGGAVARQPGMTAESSARTDADDGYPVGRAS